MTPLNSGDFACNFKTALNPLGAIDFGFHRLTSKCEHDCPTCQKLSVCETFNVHDTNTCS